MLGCDHLKNKGHYLNERIKVNLNLKTAIDEFFILDSSNLFILHESFLMSESHSA